MAKIAHELEMAAASAEHAASQRPTTPIPVQRRRGRAFLIAALVAFGGYLVLLVLVRFNRQLRLDIDATLHFQRRRHPLLARLMTAVSWFGFRPQSFLLPSAAVGALWVLRFRLESIFLGLAWLASFGNFLTKLVVNRPRPQGFGIRVAPAKILHSSFPSGHVLHYLAFWGFLSYIVFTKATSPIRWAVLAVVGVFVSLVGASRVYLGHHWLTDVLASYLLGFAYLIGLVTLYRRVRARMLRDRGPGAPR